MSTLSMVHFIKRINFKHFLRLRQSLYSSYTSPIRPTKSFREAKYLEKDNIPNDFRIIYRAPMANYLSTSKNITTITSSLITLLLGYKFATDANFINIPLHLDFSQLNATDSDLIGFSIGFILITIALRIVISKYPLRIYRNNAKYIAIYEGQLPFKNYRIHFQKGDVSEHSSNFLNPWRGSMYKIKNRSSLLITDHFKTPSELYQMLK